MAADGVTVWSVSRQGLSAAVHVVCDDEARALQIGRRVLGVTHGAAGDDGQAQAWWEPGFPHYADKIGPVEGLDTAAG